MINVNNLNMQAPPLLHAAFRVNYNDTLPTTQAACQKLWNSAYTYAHFDGIWEKVELITARGIWLSNKCTGPNIQLDDGIFNPDRDDDSYRIVASARTDGTTGAPTRSVRVSSTFMGTNRP